MASEAKRAGNARHTAKLDQIKIQPYKEEGARIRTAAAEAGMSLQAYILQAVREKLEGAAPDPQPFFFGAAEGESAPRPSSMDQERSAQRWAVPPDPSPRTFRGEDRGPCRFTMKIPEDLYLDLKKALIQTRQHPEPYVLEALRLYTLFQREGLSLTAVQAAAEAADESAALWLAQAIRQKLQE